MQKLIFILPAFVLFSCGVESPESTNDQSEVESISSNTALPDLDTVEIIMDTIPEEPYPEPVHLYTIEQLDGV